MAGHQEGICHIDSKDDGIYLASNSKDQLLKIWDIRKMCDLSLQKGLPFRRANKYEYKKHKYPFKYDYSKHAEDNSVMTFCDHDVQSTLVRCYFSPKETTGQRYVYTNSSDERIYIYDLLSGDTAMILPQEYLQSESDKNRIKFPTRDLSWHPKFPVITQTCFDKSIKIYSYENVKVKDKNFKDTELPYFQKKKLIEE